MIKIAIVDDDPKYTDTIEEYLVVYGKEKHEQFFIDKYDNAASLLENFSKSYDIVMLDIQMPGINGMDAARKIRELDENVVLFFITNYSKYAMEGYEVNAVDYILKPISYFEFELKFTKGLKKAKHNTKPADSDSLAIKTELGVKKIYPNEIYYIKVQGHFCEYVTKYGSFRQYQTLKDIESRLKNHPFSRCNNCFLVNLEYVREIRGQSVFVGDDELQISYPKKRHFVKSFMDYISKSKK